ncbi:MAG: glycosyltransferase [Prochlorococcaceae cyanobacterium]
MAALSMIVLVGDHRGFEVTGGIRTLAKLLQEQLHKEGSYSCIVTAKHPHPKGFQKMVVLGCSSPWAYGLVIKTRLLHPKREIHWIPCFHPPRFVRHRWKAHLARWALRRLQAIGITVHALSRSEQVELSTGRCNLTSLPFALHHQPGPSQQRIYSLVFLGRPVEQKGWHSFLELVRGLPGRALALVPSAPLEELPDNLDIKVALEDGQIPNHLRQCRILFIPSDYESFGFAQAQALAQGCCVPVLGEWPLWIDVPQLDWRGESLDRWRAKILELLRDENLRQTLVKLQQHSWLLRPERQAPKRP